MSIAKLLSFIDRVNLTDELDADELIKLGSSVTGDFEIDEQSRASWASVIQEAMALAKQTKETKVFPFNGASNVKYPLITLATIQLAANTYPQLIHNGKIVQAEAIGQDPDGTRQGRADRIAEYMSHQLLVESNTWEQGLDKLLHSWPIVGTSFKKIYYDSMTKAPCFELCSPADIVVNNNIKDLESARRISHRIYLYKNDIIERMRSGLFREMDLDHLTASGPGADRMMTDPSGATILGDSRDEDPAYEFVEQHRWEDLDGDGYKEPYIVTVHKESGVVFRIAPRFDETCIHVNADGEIVRIDPIQYFVDYHFIPSPDNSYYSIGFGTLLTPLNQSINTLINQLIDAGTYANTQSGFIGRGLKVNNADVHVEMGRFQFVDVGSGVDISKQIYLFPFKEPSSTLFQLLGVMMQTGKEIANITQIMTGDQPTQNVPATTMIETLRQGMKVFNSVQRRLFRSLKKEFDILYRINRVYGDPIKYMETMNDQLAILQKDFEDDKIIVKPIADPNVSSTAEKYARLNVIPQIAQMFPQELNRQEALKEYLLGLEFKDVERFINQPDPNAPPPPEAQKLMAEAQAKMIVAQAAQLQAQAAAHDSETKRINSQIKIVESGAKIEKMKAQAFKDLHDVNMDIEDKHIQHRKIDNEERKLEALNNATTQE